METLHGLEIGKHTKIAIVCHTKLPNLPKIKGVFSLEGLIINPTNKPLISIFFIQTLEFIGEAYAHKSHKFIAPPRDAYGAYFL
jgi:hypothetical protein